MDCSLPAFSVHGILQARILAWVAIPFSRGSSWHRDQTCISFVSCTDRQFLYHWHHLGSPPSITGTHIKWQKTIATESNDNQCISQPGLPGRSHQTKGRKHCRKQCYGDDAVTLYHISAIISAGLTPLPDVDGLNVMVLWYSLTQTLAFIKRRVMRTCFIFIFLCLFIWLHWVLAVACGSFDAHVGSFIELYVGS